MPIEGSPANTTSIITFIYIFTNTFFLTTIPNIIFFKIIIISIKPT